jgi:RNA polymerase sigma-70 factor (ECF subfamily)
MDDAQLHERIIMLDPSALAEWEGRYRPAVIGWLIRGGLSSPDAEEVWNDVFAATINASATLEPMGVSLRRYAFRVARNLRADHFERRSRLVTTPLDDAITETPDPDPTRSLPDPSRVTALRECLERCPERYRVVIELAETGHDVSELAAALGVAPDSVYQIRHRARQWLQRCVTEELT